LCIRDSTNPSGALATVSVVAVVAAAVMVRVAADRRAQVAAAVATVLVLVAAICEGVQLFDPGFSPIHGGGYGAVFVGFTAGFTVHLLGAAYWLETIAADRTAEVGLRLRELRAAVVFVTFLAAVAVIATILIYLV
jgi:hypothetical protein